MTTFISSGNVSILLPIITLNCHAFAFIYILPGIPASKTRRSQWLSLLLSRGVVACVLVLQALGSLGPCHPHSFTGNKAQSEIFPCPWVMQRRKWLFEYEVQTSSSGSEEAEYICKAAVVSHSRSSYCLLFPWETGWPVPSLRFRPPLRLNKYEKWDQTSSTFSWKIAIPLLYQDPEKSSALLPSSS